MRLTAAGIVPVIVALAIAGGSAAAQDRCPAVVPSCEPLSWRAPAIPDGPTFSWPEPPLPRRSEVELRDEIARGERVVTSSPESDLCARLGHAYDQLALHERARGGDPTASWDAALAYYGRALPEDRRRSPSDALLHHIAAIHGLRGEVDRRDLAYFNLMRAQPGSPYVSFAYLALAGDAEAGGAYDEAGHRYTRAASVGVGAVACYALYRRGWAELRTGAIRDGYALASPFEEALACLDRAPRVERVTDELRRAVLASWIAARLRAPDGRGAAGALQRAVAESDALDSIRGLAAALVERNRAHHARELLARAADLFPSAERDLRRAAARLAECVPCD